MDLIRGNALVFLTMICGTAFLILWGQVDDGLFRRTFDYSRKAARKYEYGLLAKMLPCFGALTLVVYYVLGYLIGITGYNIWQITFVMLTMLLMYFVVGGYTTFTNTVLAAVVAVLSVFLLPMVVVFLVFSMGVSLDKYCHIYTLVLLLWNVVLFYQSEKYWRKGDIR